MKRREMLVGLAAAAIASTAASARTSFSVTPSGAARLNLWTAHRDVSASSLRICQIDERAAREARDATSI